jgi:hypothetical protein
VTVKVIVEVPALPSACETSAIVTVGAASSFWMVPVASAGSVAVPAVTVAAECECLIELVFEVSNDSDIDMVAVVVPARIVTVPVAT